MSDDEELRATTDGMLPSLPEMNHVFPTLQLPNCSLTLFKTDFNDILRNRRADPFLVMFRILERPLFPLLLFEF